LLTSNDTTFCALALPALGPVVAPTSLTNPNPSKCWSSVAWLIDPLYAAEQTVPKLPAPNPEPPLPVLRVSVWWNHKELQTQDLGSPPYLVHRRSPPIPPCRTDIASVISPYLSLSLQALSARRVWILFTLGHTYSSPYPASDARHLQPL
jgi:hypothetical protein